MTTCYLVPAGQTEISRKGRDPGWRKKRDGSPLALDRDGYKQTRTLATQLRGKGITRIYCADVHASTAQILKTVLDVPIEVDERLRPFNVGTHTCRSSSAIDDILTKLLREWQVKPELPIKGGDSLISFRNRFLKAADKLLGGDSVIALVLDLRGIRFLRSRDKAALVDDHSLRPDRIYILRREPTDADSNQSAPAMDLRPERSSAGAVHA